jgi:hypothetical protein
MHVRDKSITSCSPQTYYCIIIYVSETYLESGKIVVSTTRLTKQWASDQISTPGIQVTRTTANTERHAPTIKRTLHEAFRVAFNCVVLQLSIIVQNTIFNTPLDAESKFIAIIANSIGNLRRTLHDNYNERQPDESSNQLLRQHRFSKIGRVTFLYRVFRGACARCAML